MSNGELHAREREDLALHVERCAERYTAVRAEICGLRKQSRRIEAAIWGIVAVLVALGAGGAQILPILRALGACLRMAFGFFRADRSEVFGGCSFLFMLLPCGA